MLAQRSFKVSSTIGSSSIRRIGGREEVVMGAWG
jgi:hypothetical protein